MADNVATRMGVLAVAKGCILKRFVMIVVCLLVPLALSAEPAFATKMVALTFDDGPSRNTNTVIDILRTHEASATFFFVGKRMTSGAFDKDALLSVGEIANHTYTHSASRPWRKMSYSRAKWEIKATNDKIRDATGQNRFWFRTMGLERNTAVKRAIKDTGVTYVGGVLVKDYGSSSANRAASIKSRVKSKAAKDHTILILHETNKETVKALPGILDWYKSRGYKVVTVSQLKGLN